MEMFAAETAARLPEGSLVRLREVRRKARAGLRFGMPPAA